MKEYSIIPEISHRKFLPFLLVVSQLVAIGLGIFGYFLTSVGFILAACYQICAFYWAALSLCDRYYRLNVSFDSISVQSIFNKTSKYDIDTLRWKILRIPWYRNYYILLYSSRRSLVAIVKPHWKNALEIMRLPHLGKLSPAEIDYLNFLKRNGRLPPNISQIKQK